jgi:hypothetical protein
LRVVLPRRRGRAGLGGLAAVAVLAAAGCGGGDTATDGKTASTAPPPAPAQTTARKPQAETIGDGLAIGLSENNANLLWHPGDGPAAPGFEPWRERATALRPHLVRITVDWANLQPDPGKPAAFDQRADGCMRGKPPCAPYAGIRDQLRAIASQQAADGGFQAMVVFYGVPRWAAAKPAGCERPGIEDRSRPVSDQGLEGYRRLARSFFDLTRKENVEVKWWSVWNEPNGAFFISPQRAECNRDSPPVSGKVYTRLARALKAELDQFPGDQHLVIGEMAGVAKAGRYGTGSGQFMRSLPDDVICNAAVVAQHEYATLPGARTLPGDPVAETEKALDARPCARRTPLWITETGVGNAHAGDDRPTGAKALRDQCAALHRQLREWYDDPRIQAAFQHTFREDPIFPVGLVDSSLSQTYPTYDLLKAWAGGRSPDDPAPAAPERCAPS